MKRKKKQDIYIIYYLYDKKVPIFGLLLQYVIFVLCILNYNNNHY